VIHLLFSRLRSLLVPAIVLTACVAVIFLLRNAGGKPRGQLLMQAEMNRQFDTFQAALAQANDAQIEMQRRMLRAEEIRVALTTQFERSQKELVQTQRALHDTNQALLATQDALRRTQEDYERVRAGSAVAVAEAPPVSVANLPEPEAITDVQRQELEKLRQDNLRLAEAVAQSEDYFARLWSDYTETGSALASAKAQLSAQKSPGFESIQPPPPERAPDFGTSVSIGGAVDDVVPKISNRLLKMWIAERFDVRSTEMISLQQRLTKVSRAIEDVTGKLVERQKALAAIQSELLERRREK
jgi:hypothetical protein